MEKDALGIAIKDYTKGNRTKDITSMIPYKDSNKILIQCKVIHIVHDAFE